MSWLAFRQMRANAAIAMIATAAIVAVLVVTQNRVAPLAATDGLSTGYKSLQLLGTMLVGVPAFIGAFWGAPLLARELETSTYQLVWTQSATRTRWLASKLAVGGLLTIVVTATFSLAFTWWSSPLDQTGNRIGTANFGQRGIVPIAYGLFAFVLGTFIGAVLRRTLPAMATTLVAFFIVRFSFQTWLRPNLMTTIAATRPNNLVGQRDESPISAGAWVLSSKTVDATGRALSNSEIDAIINRSCGATIGSPRDLASCVDQLGFHDIVRLHPANQFWPLQVWESACFLGLAGVLTISCFWWIRYHAR